METILHELANERPIFHSEADLQFALAWKIKETYPDAKIRLEYPFDLDKRIYADIVYIRGNQTTVVELKYKPRQLTHSIDLEKYVLKNQGAQDLGRYDFLLDIQRLESLKEKFNHNGYAIFITNDQNYWNVPRRKNTVDAEFRLHNGRILTGRLAWKSHASPGTTKNREPPIVLNQKHQINWKKYSNLKKRNTQFNYVILKI